MSNSPQTPPKNIETGREVINILIEEGFISLRGLSPKRLRFEIEYGLERGSTANSFLITTNDASNEDLPPTLIHPPGVAFKDIFIKNLISNLPAGSKDLLVIVGHVNPNRVSLLQALATIFTNMKLVCSGPGSKLLQEIWHQQIPSKIESKTNQNHSVPNIPEIQIIKKQERILISNGYQLRLIPAPTARWPGGLLAFEENLGLLMSDKYFAAHLCTKDWAEANRSSTEEDRRYYFDCLMAPMANQVDALVEKIEELDIQTIAPGHGPAIDTSWRSLLKDYRRWGEGQENSLSKVVLLFASAYGNTAAIADALANGVRRTGVQVEIFNCEFTPTNQLIKAIQSADGYLIGSPTLGGHAPTPIVSALGTLLAEGNKKKPVGVFGSYGWSGEALDLLESKLRDGGFEFGFQPIKIKFSPDPAMIKTLEETGTLFGRNLQQAKNRQQRRTAAGMTTSRSDSKVLALGRIVGSLCVLIAKKNGGEEELTGAMVASWVSQASFNPPGLSIAVAKDRAVEALLHCDDRFSLNVLASGREQKLMKQFLQPFPPGADRLLGLTLDESPAGQPILPEALAWLEGCVKQRMECGDHWLIYAEILHGQVLDQKGITALHHRRTGANY